MSGAGELPPGAQLPTELELRERYEASRNTIRDAIKRPTSLGLVETRPGQGTFVVQKIDPFVTTLTGDPTHGNAGADGTTTYLSEVSEQHRQAKTSAPRVEVQAPQPEIAARLRVEPGKQVVSHEERFIDEIP